MCPHLGGLRLAELGENQLGCSSEHEEQVEALTRRERFVGGTAAAGERGGGWPDREPGAWNGKLVRLREMLHRKCP